MDELATWRAVLEGEASDAERIEAIGALGDHARVTGSVEAGQLLLDLAGKATTNVWRERLLRPVGLLRGLPDSSAARALVGNRHVAYLAVKALGACVDPEAEATLIEVLRDQPKLQFPAAEALATAGTSASVPVLVDVISSTNNPMVKRSCLQALRRIDAAGHVELFAALYASERSAEVRWHCLVALRDHGGPDSIDPVIARLRKLLAKKDRSAEYRGGPLLAPRDIVHIHHRADEGYATEVTLGLEYLGRFTDDARVAAFFARLDPDRLLPHEREVLP